MWGLMFRIRGAHVDATVPDWLTGANSSFAAIDQVRRAAHEMAIRPEAYAFDHGAAYSVLFQTWDRAHTDIRSVAFGRDVTGHRRVGLLPDPYYVGSRGYAALRRTAATVPQWALRSDIIAWRGSVTGTGLIAEPEDLPRVRLALACRDMPGADVGLIGVHSTMTNVLPSGTLDGFIASHRLLRNRWNVADFGRHKFTFDIDGHANAWGLLEKLILGCCVLKVGSPFEQWYYDRLLPWRHFVPIKSDLSDLAEIVDWCRDNAAQCAWIADNGARLAAALTLERDLPQTCRTLMAAAYAQPTDPSTRSASRNSETVLPLLAGDAILRAESTGDLDLAIASYAQLIDVEGDRADTLMRRYDLLRQRGDFAEAQANLERAAVSDPANDEVSLRLGQFLASVGRDITAIRHFEQAMSAAPDRAEVKISLSLSYLRLNWLDRAFWTVRQTPGDLPGWWADSRREAMDAYSATRSRTLAILAERRANGGLPPEQNWDLTVGLASLGRLKAAWRLCQSEMSRTPDHFAPAELASRIMARWRDPAEALRYLETATTDVCDINQLMLRRAVLLFELGCHRQALDNLSSSSTLEERHPLGRRIAAFCRVFLGQMPALRAHCRAWMERSPGDMLPAELVCGAQPIHEPNGSNSQVSPGGVSIVQFWHDQDIPSDVQAVMDTWADFHPGLRQHVHCLESARAFLLAEYDADTIEAFDVCEDVATKAAFFRFAWLHRHGGVWIDVDQQCIRSVASTLEASARAGITAVRSGYINGYLENAFIGARAGSQPAEMALKKATDAILASVRRGERIWSWAAVGPGLITRVVAQHLCQIDSPDDALLLPPFTYQSYAMTVDTLAYKAQRRRA
jgi:tetratricopeptide (TPR) repeat protein